MKAGNAGWALAILMMLSQGCAGYRVGLVDTERTTGQTVFVQPVVNQTLEPRLGEALTSALRRQIQSDGTFRLAGRETADLILSVTAFTYGRQAVSFDPDDVVRPRDLQVRVQARARVVERSTGRVVLDQLFQGRQLMRIGPDMASAERQALPQVAEDLARQMVLALVEGSW
ncbi:MAG: LPS assembly lipoprotein LptE [Verrucomicrobiota bacterium]|nr:LPS assembly lipoprotein LptE [Limisphaera sp.]MDW8381466.1 LPS assembly lipoprotein LptE [Verrucomicrobiota bacterium]